MRRTRAANTPTAVQVSEPLSGCALRPAHKKKGTPPATRETDCSPRPAEPRTQPWCAARAPSGPSLLSRAHRHRHVAAWAGGHPRPPTLPQKLASTNLDAPDTSDRIPPTPETRAHPQACAPDAGRAATFPPEPTGVPVRSY